jgi:hypothetical protein
MISGNSDFVQVGQWTFNVHHISSIRNTDNNSNGNVRLSLISGEVIYLSEDEHRTLEKAINRQQTHTRALMGR